MSYHVLSIALSLIVGLLAMALCVGANAPAENPFRVVWGSLAFWAIVAILAWLTAGWISAVASVIGGCALFLLVPENLGSVLFTWGRAFGRVANNNLLRNTFFSPPLLFCARTLQNLQGPLSYGWRKRR
jgi:hypothetical protein